MDVRHFEKSGDDRLRRKGLPGERPHVDRKRAVRRDRQVPAGTSKEEVASMWRNLLAERFGLVLHRESKEFQVQELVVARGGSKLKDTAEDLSLPLPPGPPKLQNGDLLSPGYVSMIFPGPIPRAHTIARAQPISQLTQMLTNQLDRPVLDKTGLSGRYDFMLDYALRSSSVPAPSPGAAPADAASDPEPDIAVALQQQLGLRLVAARAMLDVVVIDKAEKVPTAN
jgi:uncharacterized protein (TIGR03435 family)